IIFGAVIDESLTDEIRITVIATGFGEVKEEKKPAPQPVTTNVASLVNAAAKNKKIVHLGTIVDDLDAPTWQRKKNGSEEVETVTLNKNNFDFNANQEDDDKYDIPTFLRRQMD
ncbi:MAG TPA: hypothetical protein VHV54_19255, partial [Candidatus Binatia bacterium]|nr:hypothetical protein [Candidatus Binatia bacterium]